MIDYTAFFDKQAVLDQEVANYINLKSSKSDIIYIWGNEAQIYKMTNKTPPTKYTVLYHVTAYKDGYSQVAKDLNKKKPRFIVIFQDANLFPISLYNYTDRINIENASIYERVY